MGTCSGRETVYTAVCFIAHVSGGNGDINSGEKGNTKMPEDKLNTGPLQGAGIPERGGHVRFHDPAEARTRFLAMPIRPVKRAKHRFKGPLWGCPNKEPHAWGECKDCCAIYMQRRRGVKPPSPQ